MGLFSKAFGSSEDRAAHRDARAELDRVSRRDRYEETDDFLDANQKVIDAEKALPKWRRYG